MSSPISDAPQQGPDSKAKSILEATKVRGTRIATFRWHGTPQLTVWDFYNGSLNSSSSVGISGSIGSGG